MINIITKEELPSEIAPHYIGWKDFFLSRMKDVRMNHFGWNGEDKNLKAFDNIHSYIEWFCYHPARPEPYRNYGFYARELSFLSSFMNPKVVVELGTNYGAGTFMLSNLNPEAKLTTVDIAGIQKAPERQMFDTGVLAKRNNVRCEFVIGLSWETQLNEKFDFCFIDANHEGWAVWNDSLWARNNKAEDYLIVWHDVCDECSDLIYALAEFSKTIDTPIYKLWDSTCAWTYKKGGNNEP